MVDYHFNLRYMESEPRSEQEQRQEVIDIIKNLEKSGVDSKFELECRAPDAVHALSDVLNALTEVVYKRPGIEPEKIPTEDLLEVKKAYDTLKELLGL